MSNCTRKSSVLVLMGSIATRRPTLRCRGRCAIKPRSAPDLERWASQKLRRESHQQVAETLPASRSTSCFATKTHYPLAANTFGLVAMPCAVLCLLRRLCLRAHRAAGCVQIVRSRHSRNPVAVRAALSNRSFCFPLWAEPPNPSIEREPRYARPPHVKRWASR